MVGCRATFQGVSLSNVTAIGITSVDANGLLSVKISFSAPVTAGLCNPLLFNLEGEPATAAIQAGANGIALSSAEWPTDTTDATWNLLDGFYPGVSPGTGTVS